MSISRDERKKIREKEDAALRKFKLEKISAREGLLPHIEILNRNVTEDDLKIKIAGGDPTDSLDELTAKPEESTESNSLIGKVVAKTIYNYRRRTEIYYAGTGGGNHGGFRLSSPQPWIDKDKPLSGSKNEKKLTQSYKDLIEFTSLASPCTTIILDFPELHGHRAKEINLNKVYLMVQAAKEAKVKVEFGEGIMHKMTTDSYLNKYEKSMVESIRCELKELERIVEEEGFDRVEMEARHKAFQGDLEEAYKAWEKAREALDTELSKDPIDLDKIKELKEKLKEAKNKVGKLADGLPATIKKVKEGDGDKYLDEYLKGSTELAKGVLDLDLTQLEAALREQEKKEAGINEELKKIEQAINKTDVVKLAAEQDAIDARIENVSKNDSLSREEQKAKIKDLEGKKEEIKASIDELNKNPEASEKELKGLKDKKDELIKARGNRYNELKTLVDELKKENGVKPFEKQSETIAKTIEEKKTKLAESKAKKATPTS